MAAIVGDDACVDLGIGGTAVVVVQEVVDAIPIGDVGVDEAIVVIVGTGRAIAGTAIVAYCICHQGKCAVVRIAVEHVVFAARLAIGNEQVLKIVMVEVQEIAAARAARRRNDMTRCDFGEQLGMGLKKSCLQKQGDNDGHQ